MRKLNEMAKRLQQEKQFKVSIGRDRFDYIAVDKNGNDLVRGTHKEVCTVLKDILRRDMRGWK